LNKNTQNVVIAGTGYQNSDGIHRSWIISEYCRVGGHVDLVREPGNQHDPNAIAVYIDIPDPLGIKALIPAQIGYIKSNTSKWLAEKIDNGDWVDAFVCSLWAPENVDWPRVSLSIRYSV
jgi:hypothetical protein